MAHIFEAATLTETVPEVKSDTSLVQGRYMRQQVIDTALPGLVLELLQDSSPKPLTSVIRMDEIPDHGRASHAVCGVVCPHEGKADHFFLLGHHGISRVVQRGGAKTVEHIIRHRFLEIRRKAALDIIIEDVDDWPSMFLGQLNEAVVHKRCLQTKLYLRTGFLLPAGSLGHDPSKQVNEVQ
jgi:hypothetical protein